jgi:hypothetical protein
VEPLLLGVLPSTFPAQNITEVVKIIWVALQTSRYYQNKKNAKDAACKT